MAATQEFIPAPKREDFTFAQLIQGREVEYPTLARAVLNSQPSPNTRIEWIVDEFRDGAIHRGVWKNYTQIFRYPYSLWGVEEGSSGHGGAGEAAKAQHDFLWAIEQTLIHGTPSRTTALSTCGGYRHYLGRDLNANDILALRPLREPFLWTHEWKFDPDHGWYALDTPMYEWLAEVSLQIIPQAE